MQHQAYLPPKLLVAVVLVEGAARVEDGPQRWEQAHQILRQLRQLWEIIRPRAGGVPEGMHVLLRRCKLAQSGTHPRLAPGCMPRESTWQIVTAT